ncbi:MAG: hypothetical protein FJY85_12765 [Deltaproteobacteria bacterium]|nr:hypothetical protein [Deltaproteobacteria bacterium]
MIPFTYYGDLLGVGNYYRLSSKVAQDKLHEFYNETFHTLRNYVSQNGQNRIEMFSDSLFVIGVDAIEGLRCLGVLYGNLLRKDLLLRGGMVEGMLSFEPRVTIENFEKRLPKDDTLAKAAGLEKSQKGSRLLIENTLVAKLMGVCPDWLTHEGYIRTKMNSPLNGDVLRWIAPTPDSQGYEYLYYWTNGIQKCEFKIRSKHLMKLASLQDSPGKEQCQETARLIGRCEIRFTEANEAFGQPSADPGDTVP